MSLSVSDAQFCIVNNSPEGRTNAIACMSRAVAGFSLGLYSSYLDQCAASRPKWIVSCHAPQSGMERCSNAAFPRLNTFSSLGRLKLGALVQSCRARLDSSSSRDQPLRTRVTFPVAKTFASSPRHLQVSKSQSTYTACLRFSPTSTDDNPLQRHHRPAPHSIVAKPVRRAAVGWKWEIGAGHDDTRRLEEEKIYYASSLAFLSRDLNAASLFRILLHLMLSASLCPPFISIAH